MATQYRCRNQQRLKLVKEKSGVNGIDFLEVASDQRSLQLHFANELPITPAVTRSNVVVTGGVRVVGATLDSDEDGVPEVSIDGDLRVIAVTVAAKLMTVHLNQPGDFSTYTLHVVTSSTNLDAPPWLDRQLASVDFSFKVDCPSDFDCAPDDLCPPATLDEPEINYLAKDYTSLRRLLFDRLSVIMPDWQERNAADVGVALVELLAYVGDHLSYTQDAVATEAYLGTARRRTSVRRHARLLDYAMHDGSNARTWVCFNCAADDSPVHVPAHTPLLTRGTEDHPSLDEATMRQLLPHERPVIFETIYAVDLRVERNAVTFYTWQEADCCLPRGATRATLYRQRDTSLPSLTLTVGDVLVFAEVKSPTTGLVQDADPGRRHAVRLVRVDNTVQDTLPATAIDLVEVEWGAEDALPFSLCLSAVIEGNLTVEDVTIACANVVLADHGVTLSTLTAGQAELLATVPSTGVYAPRLTAGPVTQQGGVNDPVTNRRVVFDPTGSARSALEWAVGDALPVIYLDDGSPQRWTPLRDLLASDRFAKELVVEVGAAGEAQLRFGDDILGQRPRADVPMLADYRIGNGRAGNVGADALTRVVTAQPGVKRVWNPLPAVGGVDPEEMEQVVQFAPQAFRTQQRAVTEADYEEVTQRRADVQKAKATLRWTGSWYTAFVTVDRFGGRPVDARFEVALRRYLNRYRLAGYDLEINAPGFLPLEIVLQVCARSGSFRADVKQALLRSFSATAFADGSRGFFHPDNFTFGQPLYLSDLYARALKVPGVESISVVTFQRWGGVDQGEKEAGLLTPGPFEVLQLDNDPNFPENGRLEFIVQGGL